MRVDSRATTGRPAGQRVGDLGGDVEAGAEGGEARDRRAWRQRSAARSGPSRAGPPADYPARMARPISSRGPDPPPGRPRGARPPPRRERRGRRPALRPRRDLPLAPAARPVRRPAGRPRRRPRAAHRRRRPRHEPSRLARRPPRGLPPLVPRRAGPPDRRDGPGPRRRRAVGPVGAGARRLRDRLVARRPADGVRRPPRRRAASSSGRRRRAASSPPAGSRGPTGAGTRWATATAGTRSGSGRSARARSPRQLTRDEADAKSIAWAPDGRSIAFVADPAPGRRPPAAPVDLGRARRAAARRARPSASPGTPAPRPSRPTGAGSPASASTSPTRSTTRSRASSWRPFDPDRGRPVARGRRWPRTSTCPIGAWNDTDLNGWMASSRPGPCWDGAGRARGPRERRPAASSRGASRSTRRPAARPAPRRG